MGAGEKIAVGDGEKAFLLVLTGTAPANQGRAPGRSV
jgi:hypothetical protein